MIAKPYKRMHLLLLFSPLLIAAVGQTVAHVPETVLSVGPITVGKSRLDDVIAYFGPRIRKGDDHSKGLCYRRADGTVVTFESADVADPVGAITSIILERDQGSRSCTETARDLTAGHGVKLGQNMKDFTARLPIRFKTKGRGVLFRQELYKRKATPAEEKEMTKSGRNAGKVLIDVLVTVEARFRAGVLVRYEIAKVETVD